MKRLAFVFLGLAVLTGPALAEQCPTLMKQVDDALAASPKGDVADATTHRKAGEAAHLAGDHAKSVDELNKALAALGD